MTHTEEEQKKTAAMVALAEERDEWFEYVKDRAVAFIRRGYCVEFGECNWMTITTPRSDAFDGLADRLKYKASAKFYIAPSTFGIDYGAVSKLWIAKVSTYRVPHVPAVVYFNYDRGEDLDILHEDEEAKRLYDTVLEVLNQGKVADPPKERRLTRRRS